jgi:hypothetical protein
MRACSHRCLHEWAKRDSNHSATVPSYNGPAYETTSGLTGGFSTPPDEPQAPGRSTGTATCYPEAGEPTVGLDAIWRRTGCNSARTWSKVASSTEARGVRLPLSREPRGRPSLKTTRFPRTAGTLSPGVRIPTKFSGSQAETTTSYPVGSVFLTRRSSSTASGKANCSPTKPATKRPPRTSPGTSQRRSIRTSSRQRGATGCPRRPLPTRMLLPRKAMRPSSG